MKKCCYFEKCGGCDYQGLDYKKQLEKKQKYIEGLLSPVLLKNGYKREDVSKKFLPILGAKNPYHYRNKVHAVFGVGKNKKIVCGIYEKNSHRVVDVDSCQIENEKAVEIIRGIKDMLPSFKLFPYDEDKRNGVLRHVLIRVGEGKTKTEYMVVLVTGSKEFPGKKNFANALKEKFPEITTIVWNINDKKTSMVLGEKEEVLLGEGFVTDRLLDMDFRISPKSFYQVNKKQTTELYQCVIDGVLSKEADKKNLLVLDAYSGTGTIGMAVAPYVNKVIGVELNASAIKDAKKNARDNHISNIEFVCGDAGEYLVKVAANEDASLVSPDVVIMDPPRSGSNKAFITSLLKLKPKKIIYVSCGPESLKRDLEFLLRPKHGKRLYQVETIQPVDMFPMTKHVETVCLLSKLHEAKHHINVKVDMDELDLTSAEAKATYKEIEEWVQEHYGFHVTNLNIAQVKQKHGIIERENYNKPKSENSRQPGCPEEKVKAIEDALRHFQMI